MATSIIGQGYQNTSISGGADINLLDDYFNNTWKKDEDIISSYDIKCQDLEVVGTTTLKGTVNVINVSDVNIEDRTLIIGKGNATNQKISLACQGSSSTSHTGLLGYPDNGYIELYKTAQDLTGQEVNISDPTYQYAELGCKSIFLKNNPLGTSLLYFRSDDASYIHSSNPTENALIRLGIRTNNPTEALEVAGNIKANNTNATLSLTANGTGSFSDGKAIMNLTANSIYAGSDLAAGLNLHAGFIRAAGLHIHAIDSTLRKWFIGRSYGGGSGNNLIDFNYSSNGSSATNIGSNNTINIMRLDGVNNRVSIGGVLTPTERLEVSGNIRATGAGDTNITINRTGSGYTDISNTMGGLQLMPSGMNTNNKYTPAIKFMSTDPDFTTQNPRFLACIAGRAEDTFLESNGDNGQMGIEFFTTPTASAANSNPSSRMYIAGSGNVGINNVAPSERLHVSDGNIHISRTGVNEPATVTLRTELSSTGVNGIVRASGFSGRGVGLQIYNTNDNIRWHAGRTFVSGNANSSRFVIGSVNSSSIDPAVEVTSALVRHYTPALVLNTSNQAGINKINPTATLHVGGNALVDTILTVTDLINAPQKATAPTTGVVNGSIYYNTSTHKLQVRANGSWVDLH
jgi:hypothetical protein